MYPPMGSTGGLVNRTNQLVTDQIRLLKSSIQDVEASPAVDLTSQYYTVIQNYSYLEGNIVFPDVSYLMSLHLVLSGHTSVGDPAAV